MVVHPYGFLIILHVGGQSRGTWSSRVRSPIAAGSSSGSSGGAGSRNIGVSAAALAAEAAAAQVAEAEGVERAFEV